MIDSYINLPEVVLLIRVFGIPSWSSFVRSKSKCPSPVLVRYNTRRSSGSVWNVRQMSWRRFWNRLTTYQPVWPPRTHTHTRPPIIGRTTIRTIMFGKRLLIIVTIVTYTITMYYVRYYVLEYSTIGFIMDHFLTTTYDCFTWFVPGDDTGSIRNKTHTRPTPHVSLAVIFNSRIGSDASYRYHVVAILVPHRYGLDTTLVNPWRASNDARLLHNTPDPWRLWAWRLL